MNMNNEEALEAIKHLIGTRYAPAVKAYISQLTGRSRVVGLNDPSTRELDERRIHIHGEADIITHFRFG